MFPFQTFFHPNCQLRCTSTWGRTCASQKWPPGVTTEISWNSGLLLFWSKLNPITAGLTNNFIKMPPKNPSTEDLHPLEIWRKNINQKAPTFLSRLNLLGGKTWIRRKVSLNFVQFCSPPSVLKKWAGDYFDWRLWIWDTPPSKEIIIESW